MRSTTGYNSKEQIEKNKKHNLRYPPHLPERRQDYSSVSGGGCSARRPLGQLWPRPAGLRSQGEASFFDLAKNQYDGGDGVVDCSRIAVGGSESLRNSRGESLVDLWQRWRSGCSSQWLLYLVLSRKSDRSIGCCGDATRPAQLEEEWARMRNNAGPIFMRI